MRIIGLTGKKRAGKDTVAALIGGADRSTVKLSFAEPIRRFVAEVCGLTRSQLEQVKDGSVRLVGDVIVYPRRMMQELGTEWGRSQDRDLWVSILRNKIDHTRENYPDTETVIITDVRFENEADMIHELGGVVVEVLRPDPASNSDGHASERGLSPENVDVVLHNYGTLEELRHHVGSSLPYLISSLEEFQQMRQELCSSSAANPACFINAESDLVA